MDNAEQATKAAEIWDTESHQWCEAAEQAIERMYHSTALLLPDGSVFSAGGGERQGLIQQQNAEIFKPPYMFKGPAPVIASPLNQSVLTRGQPLIVELGADGPGADDVERAALVRLGATTHQFDMSQRYVPLVKLPNDLGNFTTVFDVPESEYELPDGWYMLFVMSDAGVPGTAPYVRVQGP